jgi:hypothetical protein
VAISGGDGGDGDGDSLSPVFSVFLCFLPLGSFSFFLSVCLPSPYLPFSLFFSFVFLLFFSVFLSLLPSSPFLFSFGLQPFFFLVSRASLLSCALFFFSSSVFIGKNRGGTWLGRPLCYRPKNCPRNTSPPSSPTRGKLRASGVGMFLKREMVVTEEEKSSSSPASLVQGKKKTYGAIQNGTVFYSSFLF